MQVKVNATQLDPTPVTVTHSHTHGAGKAKEELIEVTTISGTPTPDIAGALMVYDDEFPRGHSYQLT
jgi:hypothetical protein